LQAIRIYIIASNSLFAQGVSSILQDQPDIQVVGLREYSAQTLGDIVALQPDVVVIDTGQSARGEITDELLRTIPGLKLVGLSLEEANITITYLQQESGAAVEDLVSAVRSLPASTTWLPLPRQMRILVAVHGPFGQRVVENIQANAPSHWNISVWRAPPLMPPEAENLIRLLPKQLPAADLVLGVIEGPHIVHMLPDMVIRSGARAMLVPVEDQSWIPKPVMSEIKSRMEELGVVVAFPKPFCSLTMRTYNEASWREIFQDAHIAEFAHYFGRPELRILFDDAQRVSRCQIRRDVACGFGRVLSEKLIGCPIDQIEKCASDLLDDNVCPNGRCADPDYQIPLRHVADSILQEAIRREIAPFLRPEL